MKRESSLQTIISQHNYYITYIFGITVDTMIKVIDFQQNSTFPRDLATQRYVFDYGESYARGD